MAYLQKPSGRWYWTRGPRINSAYSTNALLIDAWSRQLPYRQVQRELAFIGRKISLSAIRNSYHRNEAGYQAYCNSSASLRETLQKLKG